jgi:hypothetical protein
MKLINIQHGMATLTLSLNEAHFLRHAIVETLSALHGGTDFEARTGQTPKRAEELMDELGEALDRAQGGKDIEVTAPLPLTEVEFLCKAMEITLAFVWEGDFSALTGKTSEHAREILAELRALHRRAAAEHQTAP